MTGRTTFLVLTVAACAAAHGQAAPAGPPRTAVAVPRGGPRPLLTEVWTVNPDGSGGRRVRTYPGEPGDLLSLPGRGELVYLERGLRHAVFGAHLCGGRHLALAGNRVWRLKEDGSGETPWPLPDGLQPLGIAVSPDGERLTVRGHTGPGRGEEGVWVVDRGGNATRLPADPSPPGDASPGCPPPAALSHLSQDPALAPAGSALDACVTGYHAMHRGDRRAERRAWESAIRAFEALAATPGVSRGSCLGYIQALRTRIDRTVEEREMDVCRDHLTVLSDLLAGYAGAGQPPLPDLRRWAEGRIEANTLDPAVRARDLTVLAQILRCPADPDPQRQVSYASGPEGPLACFWHRGSLISPAGPGSAPFGPDRVDSLSAEAGRRLKAGEADRAVALLEVVVHHRPKDPAARLLLGHAHLGAKDDARAERAFKEAAALGDGRERARAYHGLGLVWMGRPKGLYTAIGYFRDALSRDRGFVDARYEMAKARSLLWEYDARADIEAVLRLDPGHAEARLLMGNWYADLKEDFPQAILWYAKYLAMRPEDPEGRRRLGAAYLRVKDDRGVLETLLSFAQAHPDAVEALPILAQACARQEKLDLALNFYRTYLSRLDPDERAFYEDIRPIASPEELAGQARAPGAERASFLSRFWAGRDPDLSTPVNERLLEHYRRVWFARQNFSKGRRPWDRRGEVYVRYGEPDHRTTSLMMNAAQSLAVQRVKERMALDLYGGKGLGETYLGPVFPVRSIAVRARDRARDPLASAGGVEIASDQQTQETTTLRSIGEDVTRKERRSPDTQSRVRSSGQEARLRFGDVMGMGDGARLTASLEAFGERTEGDLRFGDARPVRASDADVSRVPWESWVYTRIGGGMEVTFTDEAGRGVYDYAPIPAAPDAPADQMARFARLAPQRVAERAIAAAPDFYLPDHAAAPFHFSFDTADFRGREGMSVLEVYYAIPRSAARYLPERDVTRMVVERQAALVSTASDAACRVAGDLVFETPGNRQENGAFIPDLARLEVPPGDYRLEVRARDRMTGRLGIYRREVTVEAYGPEGLRISDLELAWRVAGESPEDRFNKGGWRVIPMPTRGYLKGQSAFVYYEVYNLVRNAEGQTGYQVEVTIGPKEGGVLSRLVRTFTGKGKGVAVGYEGRGGQETEKAYTELSLEGFDAGRYTLKVAVTDLNSGQTATKETFFSVGD